jgi:long-chain acyl-CoA synthetase
VSDTIVHRLVEQARRRPEAPATFHRDGDLWKATSWQGLADEVRAAAGALLESGLQIGEPVAILGTNRPEWVTFHLATLAAGGVSVGLDPEVAPDVLGEQLRQLGAKVLLVEDRAQHGKLHGVHLPELRLVVSMRGPRVKADGVPPWARFLRTGEKASPDARMAALGSEDAATCLLEGDGDLTRLSHGAVAQGGDGLVRDLGLHAGTRLLSHRPLHRAREQALSIHAAITAGAMVYLGRSGAGLLDDLRDVRPTVFDGGPGSWRRVHRAVLDRVGALRGLDRLLVNAALGAPGGGPVQRLAERRVLAPLRAELGLDAATLVASEAGAVPDAIFTYLAYLGLPVRRVGARSAA